MTTKHSNYSVCVNKTLDCGILGIQTVDVWKYISLFTIIVLVNFRDIYGIVMSFNLVYGPVGAGTLDKKGMEGDILGPLLHNLQLAMTDPISRGANLRVIPPIPLSRLEGQWRLPLLMSCPPPSLQALQWDLVWPAEPMLSPLPSLYQGHSPIGPCEAFRACPSQNLHLSPYFCPQTNTR